MCDFSALSLSLRRVTAIGVVLGVCAAGQADTLYVDASAGAGGDGTAWATAYRFLQDALLAGMPGDEIWVADGTYLPDQDESANVTPGSRTETFTLADGVTLLGGFVGGETNASERDVAGNPPAILSGDIGTLGDDSDNSYHVTVAGGTTATSVLDGFTITGGNANGTSGTTRYGGGLLITSGKEAAIVDCTFLANTALYGGGMKIDFGSATLDGCAFVDNVGSAQGGGAHTESGEIPSFTDCVFSGNTSSTVNGKGGGLYLRNTGTLTNCVLSGNEAQSGGGVYAISATPEITNCTFANNVATSSGGGAYTTAATSKITNCTFADNVATSSGGGLYDNTTPSEVRNCVLSDNTPDEIYSASSLDVGYSNVKGSLVSGAGNISADPLFIDANANDFRLGPGSPAIDAGDNTSVPAGVTTDLDGNPRIVDGDLDSVATVDMGAYEVSPPASPTADIAVEQLTDIGSDALVRLDGSGSSDPDDANSALQYTWTVDGFVECDGDQATCETIEVALGFGSHDVVLRVTDPLGNYDEAETMLVLDPAELSTFEADRITIDFHHNPPRFDMKGQVGLPSGVDYTEVVPMVMLDLDVAGVGILPGGAVPIVFEVNGCHSDKWKYRYDGCLLGVTRFNIDWNGARFRFRDFHLEMKSEIITSSETMLELKYRMNRIGGAFSIDIDGLAQIDVDADGNVTSSVAVVEVEKPGREVTLTLPFPLLATSTITFTGAIDETISAGDYLRASVGRFRIRAEFDAALFPDGAETSPRTSAAYLAVGASMYPGATAVDEDDLKVKNDKWKFKE